MVDFPSGGYFKGKNFVYDPRISVPYALAVEEEIVGNCLICNSIYDDYRPQMRCHSCRILVLVCDRCQVRYRPASAIAETCASEASPSETSISGEEDNRFPALLTCERCSVTNNMKVNCEN